MNYCQIFSCFGLSYHGQVFRYSRKKGLLLSAWKHPWGCHTAPCTSEVEYRAEDFLSRLVKLLTWKHAQSQHWSRQQGARSPSLNRRQGRACILWHNWVQWVYLLKICWILQEDNVLSNFHFLSIFFQPGRLTSPLCFSRWSHNDCLGKPEFVH